MTTGDEEAEGLVDDLFRDVDDQFDDLEREYSQAREELAQQVPDPSASAAAPAADASDKPADQAIAPDLGEDPAAAVGPEPAQAPEPAQEAGESLITEVDDQFADLEREYNQAREEMASTSPTRPDTPSNALEASNERFELMSQVATLQAEISRQADELDERDRMLNELGDKIAGFEAQVADHATLNDDLHAARQETLDERREQARLAALLDARAAERQELADVTNRLQHDRDHVQELLTTALARYDEAETQMAQMDDKVRHLEAARDTAAHEHEARAHELIESRAEMSKLADRLDELAKSATDADERAEKAEALAERRANEAGYLNRRLAAMTDKLDAAESFEADASNLRRELTMAERRISELERELASEQSEVAAARAAVDAIAERTSDYDELVVTIERLRQERDEAWEAASGHPPVEEPEPEPVPAPVPSTEVSSLAARARELSSRRANEAASAAQAAEEAAALAASEQTEAIVVHEVAVETEATVEAIGEETDDGTVNADLLDLDETDVDLIEADLAELTADDPAPIDDVPVIEESSDADVEVAAAAAVEPVAAGSDVDVPVFEFANADPMTGVVVPRVPEPDSAAAAEPAVTTEPAEPDPAVQPEPVPEPVAVTDTAELPAVEVADAEPPVETADAIPEISLDHLSAPAEDAASSITPPLSAVRKRTILPADLEPNTPEAVAHLLNQPGVTAIVDARSTCGRTGIRPSELFERVAGLRDHFDVPVEVVVTPVSTPVGGAPELPAIGVHHVTGADTVADRIRAICMGFPGDQPLVVVAGDDHVRRAAIGEEANVVEPAAVLNLPTD